MPALRLIKPFLCITACLGMLVPTLRAQQEDSVRPGTFACYYSENKLGDSICSNLREFSLKDNFEASEILSRVLTPVGLRPNFVLQPCDGIKNCVATTGSDGLRYIIYDRVFLNELSDTGKTNWASLSIFAHEVLHHLNQHTHIKANLEKRRQMELEADEWSGRICALLGSTLEEAQSAMELMQHPVDETFSSHPAKASRLAAIEKGYEAALANRPAPKENLKLEDFSMLYHDFVRVKTLEEIEPYKAKGLFPREILYLNQEWFAFLRKESEGFRQQMLVARELDRYELMTKQQEGWRVSSLNYRGKQWIALLESADSTSMQSFEKSPAVTPELVKSFFDKGKMITDLAYGDGAYILVLDDAAKRHCIKDTILITETFPSREISKLNREKFVTTTSKHLNGQWITIMHGYEDNFPAASQAKGSSTTFPFDQLLDYDHNGFRLRSADYDGRYWVYYFDKNKN